MRLVKGKVPNDFENANIILTYEEDPLNWTRVTNNCTGKKQINVNKS